MTITNHQAARMLNVKEAQIKQLLKRAEYDQITPYRLNILACALSTQAHQLILALGVERFIELKLG